MELKTIQDIEQAIGALPRQQLAELYAWMDRHRALALRGEGSADGIANLYLDSLTWLANNRADYAGKWVALMGSELLAVDSNAQTVYACVRGLDPPALVVQVEPEDRPFGGW